MAGEVFPKQPMGNLLSVHDSKRIPIKKSDRKSGPYPYYGASGIADWVDSYIFDGTYLLLAEDGENLRTKSLPIAFIADGKFWVNNHAHILQGQDELDTRFFCYALKIADIDGYLSGSTRPKLTQRDMKRILLPAPELLERRATAEILSSLDDKIERNHEMNRTLEAMARAIFKAWFVDFEPVKAKVEGATSIRGMPQEVFDQLPDRLVDSELGPVPEGWSYVPIGDMVDVVGGGTPSTKNPEFWEEGEYAFCTPKDMSKLSAPILLDTERHINQAGLDKISSGQLPVGAVLLSSRAPIGYLALAETPVSVNQGIIAMITGEVPNTYVLLWTEQNMAEIKSRAGGSTFAEISKRNFRPIPTLRPDDTTLQTFGEIAQPLFARMASNERESVILRVIRDALLPKLISGEIRVASLRGRNNEEDSVAHCG